MPLSAIARPIAAAWRRLRRLFHGLRDLLLIGLVVGAAGAGLTFLASHARRVPREPEAIDRPAAGITVHTEVIQAWLPEPLIVLGARGSNALVLHSHQELREMLERQGYQDAWYALRVRHRQINGESAEITFIRHPYREPENFQEFLDVVATAAGNPASDPATDYSRATVHIVPASMSERELREAIQESPRTLDADSVRRQPESAPDSGEAREPGPCAGICAKQ
jgi:hypothetical protein